MPRRILIDGYNMIRTNPSGSNIERAQGGEAARQWLISLCCRALRSDEQWHIIFDGEGCPEIKSSSTGAQLTVRFAAPLTADALLREMACDACAAGLSCLLVSSDNEVRFEGCAAQDSANFYDHVLRRSCAPKAPHSDAAEIVEKLLAYLSECGHIKRGDFVSSALRDSLREMLIYFAAVSAKPQKIARCIENLLREGIKLIPEPDAEKIIFRNLKGFFEKHTG